MLGKLCRPLCRQAVASTSWPDRQSRCTSCIDCGRERRPILIFGERQERIEARFQGHRCAHHAGRHRAGKTPDRRSAVRAQSGIQSHRQQRHHQPFRLRHRRRQSALARSGIRQDHALAHADCVAAICHHGRTGRNTQAHPGAERTVQGAVPQCRQVLLRCNMGVVPADLPG